MKKLVFAIVVLLLVSIMTVQAEDIDLSGMSDEQLLELIENSKTELLSRGYLRSGELLEGVYEVGKDIAAGTYYGKAGEKSHFGVCYYFVFSTRELYDVIHDNNFEITFDSARDDADDRIDLLDGQVLWVKSGSLYLEQAANNLLAP